MNEFVYYGEADDKSEGAVKLAGEVHLSLPLKGEIKSISGTVRLNVDDDEKIFMNGYQTWTYSPEYAVTDRIRGLHGIPSFIINRFGLDGYGDYHFVSYPNKKGILHGFSWCTFRKDNRVRLFASLDEDPGWTMFTYDHGQKTLTLERDCQGIIAEGDYPAFDLFYAEGSADEVYDAWFKAMGVKPLTGKKLYGYSSWYNRYQNIDEKAIIEDLEGCARIFEKGDLFQIDDGWEPFVGDWLTPNAGKFPGGLKKIVEEIHDKGYKAGLWLAPFVGETNSALYHDHPDWFLKHEGKLFKCGGNWSGFYALDIDRPEVQAYLEQVFKRVFDAWGFDLVKLDFLYGAAPYGSRHETRAGRMKRAMKLLRDWCKDKPILGCGVPVMSCFGLVEYCRISCDVSLDWDDKLYMRFIHRERNSTKHAVTNIITRYELNNRAYVSDPDVFFLRTENCPLTARQKRQLAQLDALLGGVFLTSDNPQSYTDEMIGEYRAYRALTGAENVNVTPFKNGVKVSFDLYGSRRTLKLFVD